jgi:hypothetical protein
MDPDHHQVWVEVLVEDEAEEEDKFQGSRPCKEEVESEYFQKYVNIILRHNKFKCFVRKFK